MKRKFRPILLALAICFCFFSCCSPSDEPETTIVTELTEPVVNEAHLPTEAAPNTTGPSTETEPVTTPCTISTEPVLPAESFFEIHYIDVGQASASLLLCDGHAMLIDAGGTDSASLIYSYLNKMDIKHLDALVVTHGHADHCGGAAAALHAASVGTVYCSIIEFPENYAFGDFTRAAADQGLPVTIPSPGDTFYLGSALVEFLGPVYPSDNPNNESLIMRITYGNTRFLFSGDAELDAENAVLDAGFDISCDVITVGHHGSSTSSGYRWIREAQAAYGVISCGKDNEYGHPHESTLSKLLDADVTLYRTDLQGDIICRSDGISVSFESERNADVTDLMEAGGVRYQETEPESATNAGVTYVLNTNTHKFHIHSCSSVDQMKDKNKKEVTCTREEVIAMGYEPCGRCRP